MCTSLLSAMKPIHFEAMMIIVVWSIIHKILAYRIYLNNNKLVGICLYSQRYRFFVRKTKLCTMAVSTASSNHDF